MEHNKVRQRHKLQPQKCSVKSPLCRIYWQIQPNEYPFFPPSLTVVTENAKGPLQNQCFISPFWASVETWWCDTAEYVEESLVPHSMVTKMKQNAQMLHFRQQYLYLAVTTCFSCYVCTGAELLRYNVAEDHFVTVGQGFCQLFVVPRNLNL